MNRVYILMLVKYHSKQVKRSKKNHKSRANKAKMQ